MEISTATEKSGGFRHHTKSTHAQFRDQKNMENSKTTGGGVGWVGELHETGYALSVRALNMDMGLVAQGRVGVGRSSGLKAKRASSLFEQGA
jgi:hypothetical protein